MSFQHYKPNSYNRMPPGVVNIIAINVILFITKSIADSKDMTFSITGDSNFTTLLSLHHPFAPGFHFYQYITSIFMHADVGHIGFNMIGLWLFGHMLENAYGTRRFLIFYLVSGIGASLIYQIWDSIHQVKMIGGSLGFFEALHQYPPYGILLGASGAVYGIMMGTAMLFPNTQMPVLFQLKMKWIAVIYGGSELVRAWQQSSSPEDHIAHFAHIGGMIFGFILVKIYSRDKTHFY